VSPSDTLWIPILNYGEHIGHPPEFNISPLSTNLY
jgi:hypothetical protein